MTMKAHLQFRLKYFLLDCNDLVINIESEKTSDSVSVSTTGSVSASSIGTSPYGYLGYSFV